MPDSKVRNNLMQLVWNHIDSSPDQCLLDIDLIEVSIVYINGFTQSVEKFQVQRFIMKIGIDNRQAKDFQMLTLSRLDSIDHRL